MNTFVLFVIKFGPLVCFSMVSMNAEIIGFTLHSSNHANIVCSVTRLNS